MTAEAVGGDGQAGRGSSVTPSVSYQEDRAMAARVAALVAYFRDAEPNMRDLPIYNPALAVEAVGFREWEGHWLGVIVSPWFVNLVLLSRDAEAWRDRRTGDKMSWSFPSREHEFIVDADAGCGPFQSLSLFSLVSAFDSQDAAREAADAALAELLTPKAADGAGEGDEDAPQSAQAAAPNDSPPQVDRRGLLRGKVRGRRTS